MALQKYQKIKKFIYISTGKISHKEEINLSSYMKCKIMIEHALIDTSKNSNIDIIILRPGIVYGKKSKGNI